MTTKKTKDTKDDSIIVEDKIVAQNVNCKALRDFIYNNDNIVNGNLVDIEEKDVDRLVCLRLITII